nr:immunoglobulin heavy chain junction region [Macaca mulatta]MOX63086.1 immunoglobulin heavy chain junction region [Macaca mulatta]MOX65356.1 immunoglobulin heavy chain junction region [Macaca mulatta]
CARYSDEDHYGDSLPQPPLYYFDFW